MLRELSVQNLALIEDVRVELQAGYCAWTGETGAGKSLLLTALGLVLGGKASADLVRAGKDEARAAAVFEVADAGAPGRRRGDPRRPARRRPVDPDPADLGPGPGPRARQRPARDGRHPPGRSAQRLIDIHGQHESRALLDPDRQRDLLDAHGGLEPPARRLSRGARGPRRAPPQAARPDPRPPSDRAARAGPARVRARRAGRRRPPARRVRRAGPRGAPPGQRRAAPRRPPPRATPCSTRPTARRRSCSRRVARRLEPLAESVPELADAAADLERLADETREVAYALRTARPRLGRRPRPARGGRGPPGPLPPARLAVPLRARRPRRAPRRDRGAARRHRARRGRPARPRRPAGRRLGRR